MPDALSILASLTDEQLRWVFSQLTYPEVVKIRNMAVRANGGGGLAGLSGLGDFNVRGILSIAAPIVGSFFGPAGMAIGGFIGSAFAPTPTPVVGAAVAPLPVPPPPPPPPPSASSGGVTIGGTTFSPAALAVGAVAVVLLLRKR